MIKGIVVVCNKDFIIEEYIFNSFSNTSHHQANIPVSNLCIPQEKTKVSEFTRRLEKDGAAFKWEMNISFDKRIKPFKFYGSKFGANYVIFALETNDDVPFLYEELMQINNQQTNYIRTILKERFLETGLPKDDESAFEELTKLNNELANLQRELFKKNTELKKLNKIKNHFLGMAAHDLRNPLGNIYNFADLLSDESDDFSTDQLTFIEQIKSQSLYMLNLVNDLLDYSSIEAGVVNLNFELVNLVDLINKILELNKSLADKKNIKLELIKNTSQVFLTIDSDKIEQTISNLISNAIKYSYPDTQVKIRIEESEKIVTVRIKDQGQGINTNEVATLFRPFQKTSNQSTAGEQSTGLGLFICKRIINAHHGKIDVTSQKGKGSEFYFSLPKNNHNHE